MRNYQKMYISWWFTRSLNSFNHFHFLTCLMFTNEVKFDDFFKFPSSGNFCKEIIFWLYFILRNMFKMSDFSQFPTTKNLGKLGLFLNIFNSFSVSGNFDIQSRNEAKSWHLIIFSTIQNLMKIHVSTSFVASKKNF